MAVHIRKQDGSVEAALRRIALLLIDEAVAAIDDAAKPLDRRIHEVRQATKKLRALGRLVRPAFARFEAMNARLRDLAQTLSGMRDAAVMAQTLEGLFEAEADDLAGIEVEPIYAGLRPIRVEASAPCDALMAARPPLMSLRNAARRWQLSAQGWEAVAPGLRATYRKARRAMHAAAKDGGAEASHAWRKEVKYHGQHIRLIEAMAPEALQDRAHQLRKLGDLLGRRHDLDVLCAAMTAHPEEFGGVEIAGRLREVARHRVRRLDKRARKLGEALFEKKPRRMMKEWHAQWRDWREDEAPVGQASRARQGLDAEPAIS